ncbi:hypothetical protein M153_7300028626 [Pseudoloma neurophilia]|uniref:Transposable element n=1 Tax=Pseudoloma neurophilia TaxID=146866 RepID=A0A0R0M6H3_9MICR|nr:hypothetical protein M153_7300028626 [Pseudoloma neurophilia]
MMNNLQRPQEEVINKFLDSELASATNAVKEYNANDNEDINLWLEELTMICRATNLNEQEQMRLIITKLRNTPRSWCSEFMETNKGKYQLAKSNVLLSKDSQIRQNQS